MLYMRVRDYIESVRERASARGVLKKKIPKASCMSYTTATFFSQGLERGRKRERR